MADRDGFGIFIVEDHPEFRRELEALIARCAGFRVVGIAEDGPSALPRIDQVRPDMVILDINLPGLSGIELGRVLHTQHPGLTLMFLTICSDEGTFNAALDTGARAFILKENAVEDLGAGLAAASAGATYVSAGVASHLARRTERRTNCSERRTDLDRLSPTERCVLRLVAENKSDAEIAAELLISPRALDLYRERISDKLGSPDTQALVRYACDHHEEL